MLWIFFLGEINVDFVLQLTMALLYAPLWVLNLPPPLSLMLLIGLNPTVSSYNRLWWNLLKSDRLVVWRQVSWRSRVVDIDFLFFTWLVRCKCLSSKGCNEGPFTAFHHRIRWCAVLFLWSAVSLNAPFLAAIPAFDVQLRCVSATARITTNHVAPFPLLRVMMANGILTSLQLTVLDFQSVKLV